MGTVRRLSRHRIENRDPLAVAWEAGNPPPSWASEPGEHRDEMLAMYFGLDGDKYRPSKTHPNRELWMTAIRASDRREPRPQRD